MAPAHTCPSCRKPLINRAKPNCLYCGKPVPAQLLFSPEEQKRREQKRSQEQREYAAHDQQMNELIANARRKKWWEFWKGR